MIVDDSSAKAPGVRTRSVVILATVILGATLAVIWLLVVPMEPACPAIYPAPRGCSTADRMSAGATWTVVIAVVYALSVTVALSFGRSRRWLTQAAMLTLVLVAIVGIGAVTGSTGFVVGC